jgi:hypothetical protein
MLIKRLLVPSDFPFFHLKNLADALARISLSICGTDAGSNRGDSIALKKKDYNTAQAAKLHLENVQRQERKLR